MGGPITRIEDLVGTGPFRVAERRPDQYTLLDKAERYTPSPMPASAYAGTRTPASARLSFLPVPNVNTRLQGLLSGEYDVADGLSTDSFAQIQRSPGIVPVITKPGGWLFLVMNSQRGLTTNPLIRQAAQAALDNEAIMTAAMGSAAVLRIRLQPVSELVALSLGCRHRAVQSQKSGGSQEAAATGRLQGRAVPHPHKPAIRLCLQGGAGHDAEFAGCRLHGGPAVDGLGLRHVPPLRLRRSGKASSPSTALCRSPP